MANGNFSGVTHEMTEILMTRSFTPHESRIIWFFIRHLQGYQMKERVIKTSEIIKGTQTNKQRVIESINSLIKKGVLVRTPGVERGEYIYSWNENLFERTHATEKVKVDRKVTDLMTYKKKNRGTENRSSESENTDLEVTESGLDGTENRTQDNQRTATVADLGFPKDIKDNKNILKKGDFEISEEENRIQKAKEEAIENMRKAFGAFSDRKRVMNG